MVGGVYLFLCVFEFCASENLREREKGGKSWGKEEGLVFGRGFLNGGNSSVILVLRTVTNNTLLFLFSFFLFLL